MGHLSHEKLGLGTALSGLFALLGLRLAALRSHAFERLGRRIQRGLERP